MAIKNIVFDLGGVLIDWNPIYVFREVFTDKQELDYFISEICNSDWNIRQDAGRSWKDAIEMLQYKHPKYKNEIALFRTHWEKMLKGPMWNNVGLLGPLKENNRIFALTNWSAETFPIAREKYPFLDEFEGIVVSGVEKMVKPDKEIYELLLERYDLKANESLFIDDGKKNIETAKELGFSTIHYVSGVDLKKEMEELGCLRR